MTAFSLEIQDTLSGLPLSVQLSALWSSVPYTLAVAVSPDPQLPLFHSGSPWGAPPRAIAWNPHRQKAGPAVGPTTLLCLMATVFKTVVSYGLSCPRFFLLFSVGISSGRVNIVLLSHLGQKWVYKRQYLRSFSFLEF